MGNQEVSKSVQMTDTGINRLFFGKRGEKALKFEEFSGKKVWGWRE